MSNRFTLVDDFDNEEIKQVPFWNVQMFDSMTDDYLPLMHCKIENLPQLLATQIPNSVNRIELFRQDEL